MLVKSLVLWLAKNLDHEIITDFHLLLFSVLKNPNTYPGKHNFPTERTNFSQQPLEPKSQVRTRVPHEPLRPLL